MGEVTTGGHCRICHTSHGAEMWCGGSVTECRPKCADFQFDVGHRVTTTPNEGNAMPSDLPASPIPAADGGCAFCHRIAVNDYCGEARGVVSFEPLSPVTEGHRLFVPRLHVPNAGFAPWVAANAFDVAADYAHRMVDDYNLITSAGRSATQTVWHFHVHYVPRFVDDGLHLPWTGQRALEAP